MLCPTCHSAFDDRGQTECPRCGAPLDRATDLAASAAEADLIPAPPAATRREPNGTGAVVARIAGVFATTGLGLGVGVLLFMWATGALDEPTGIEDLPSAILGGLAVAIALGFGLLIGVVMAILAGVYASNAARSRADATVTGMIAAAVGHVALVVALGITLLVGFAAFRSEGDAPPTTTLAPTPDFANGAPCEEIFGADAPECQEPTVPADTVEGDDEVTVRNIARLGVGVIPAALVGGLTGAILFTRRRRT